MGTHLQQFLGALKAARSAETRFNGMRFGSAGWNEAQRDMKVAQNRVDFLILSWPENELEAPSSIGELGAHNSEDAWIQTFSGVNIYPLKPDISKINIADVAHSLAQLNRYNGHSLSPINVAYHSVVVSMNVRPELAFAGLLHDAPEYILGDICRPIKHTPLFAPYRKLEDEWLALFGKKYGFETPLDKEIKLADNGALLYEQSMYMAAPPKPWRECDFIPITHFPKVNPDDVKGCEILFLRRFAELKGL